MGMPFVTASQLEKAIKESKSSLNPQEVVDVVNTAIENGDIEIPAGGTKLYLHSLSLDYGNTCVFISTDSNPVTVTTDFYKIAGRIISFNIHYWGFVFPSIVYSDNYNLYKNTYNSSDGTYTQTSIGVGEFISDTVTEL